MIQKKLIFFSHFLSKLVAWWSFNFLLKQNKKMNTLNYSNTIRLPAPWNKSRMSNNDGKVSSFFYETKSKMKKSMTANISLKWMTEGKSPCAVNGTNHHHHNCAYHHENIVGQSIGITRNAKVGASRINVCLNEVSEWCNKLND